MKYMQFDMFGSEQYESKTYRPFLTAGQNGKGVLDVDTVKGCSAGMAKYPQGGCYGECYAYKTATRYGIDFSKSVSRKLYRSNREDVFIAVINHSAGWYRIGVSGDPCHDWENTVSVASFLKTTGKVPVIITKHWQTMGDEHISELGKIGAIINTSLSPLDTEEELNHRTEQLVRLKYMGIKSVARIVTCNFNETQLGVALKHKQDKLLAISGHIDNPLRASQNNKLVTGGHISLTKRGDSVGGGKFVSLHNDDIYLGTCGDCPDQCGFYHAKKGE